MSYWSQFSFSSPWLLLTIPLLWLLYIIALRRNKQSVNLPWANQNLGLSPVRKIANKVVDWLIPVALTMMCFALARPLKFFNEEKVKADGIDIILAMDVSASMLTQDFTPDRLSVAKELAIAFVESRGYDRLGMVVFSGEAFTQCPLTSNHDVLKSFIGQLRPGLIEDGTAIGTGLATALNAVKNSTSKSKIVILLTDGENNAGDINPNMAAEMAASLNVKVYTIGMGTEGIAQAPVNIDENGNYLYAPRKLSLDPSTLIEIAKISNGKFYRAQTVESLKEVYSDIDKLEKTEVEINVYRRQSEYFRWFLMAGVFCLSFHYLLKIVYLKQYIQ
jgi:Ca-activated chloride channel homolog